MADVRTSIMILEDVVSQAGVPLHRANIADSSIGKNSHGVFASTDAGDLFRYMKVNANRELHVTLESADYANLNDTGDIGGNAAFTTVLTIPLVPGAVYNEVSVLYGCTRDAEFKLVHNDDGTPADIMLGMLLAGGKISGEVNMPKFEFTAGGTGTQELKLQGKNYNAVSNLKGTVALREVQI